MMAVRALLALTTMVVLASACNLLIGLEEGIPRPPEAAGGSGACDPSGCPGVDEECRVRVCDVTGQCGFAPADAGKACTAGGGKVCNGQGTCVECATSADCTDPSEPDCVMGQCVPAHCTNTTKDGDETDLNCGGSCPPCTDGMACVGGDDCVSGFCANNVCQPCGDSVDCMTGEFCNAGVCQEHKVLGQNCGTGGECASGYCTDGVCCDVGGCPSCQACNLGVGTCGAQPDGTGCNDGTFCNGGDQCSGGSCSVNFGNPCPAPTGDPNCSESCDENSDSCSAPDPDGTPCDDYAWCTGSDSCSGGSCSNHSGDPCPGADGDDDCAESCDENSDSCFGWDPDFSGCYVGGCCGDYCYQGACQFSG